MAIADYIPIEETIAVHRRVKETRRLAKPDIALSHTFEKAASRHERAIARAIANEMPFGLLIDGIRPVEKATDTLRCIWDFFSFMGTHIETKDVENNSAYQEFQRQLQTQGLEVESLSMFSDYRIGSIAFMQIKAKPPAI